METIGTQRVRSYGKNLAIESLSCDAIRLGEATPVTDFRDLACKVAEIQFRNRDFVFLFRGQSGDYRNAKKRTSIRPTILRPENGQKAVSPDLLADRFLRLATAERDLLDKYRSREGPREELQRLSRERILRWSILQHYEVCPTPLLDVTQSLRIAASFASLNGNDEGYVFVLGLPNLSGAITASVESGVQIVRLASVCPAEALRPHLQEGYLLGEYPEVASLNQKEHYQAYEMDFGRRLVAKFRFQTKKFWRARDFPRVSRSALYPKNDPWQKVASGSIKQAKPPKNKEPGGQT